MKNTMRKLLPLLLCLVMVFSLFPASAFADDAEQVEAVEAVEAVEVAEEPAAEAAEDAVEETVVEEVVAEAPVEEPAATEVTEAAEEPVAEASAAVEQQVETEAVVASAGTTGWVKDGNAWTYYVNGEQVVDDWQKVSGKWYYFDESGYMIANDYIQIDGSWYVFNKSGAWIGGNGWAKLTYSPTSYYSYDVWFYLKGGVATTGWQKIGGTWYYFEPNMATGVWEIDGKLNVFNGNGAWVSGNGWKSVKYSASTYWLYLKNSEPVTGWQTIGGKRYYFNEWGYMATGTYDIDGTLYLFDKNGQQVKKGWASISWSQRDGSTYTVWYYALADGTVATGWQTINGKTYYFWDDGTMATGSLYIDDTRYILGSDGALVKNGWCKQKIYWADGSSETIWMYAGEDGTGYTGWVKSGSNWYYFNEGWPANGSWWIEENSATYLFNANGTLSKGGWVKVVYHMESGTETHWCYANKDGTGYTGWVKSGSDWYYFSDGWSCTGAWWIEENSATYLFNANGTLSKGGWVHDTTDYWDEDGNYVEVDAWYYANANGTPKSGWVKSGSNWYYFDSDNNCIMAADTSLTINGKTYNFNASGVCTNP